MKEKLKKINISKKKVIYILVLLVMFVIGFSFAYWQKGFNQTGLNVNSYDCFKIEYTETEDNVEQLYGFPQADSDGLKNDPYTLKITNTCNTYTKYQVVYNVLNNSNYASTLSDSYVKIGVNNSAKLLTSFSSTTSSLSGVRSAYIIAEGALRANQSKEYKIRSWMNVNTTESQGANKEFYSQITVEASAAFDYKLSGLIRSEEVVTSGDGLYKARGDTLTENGNSTFYYKGNNVNNYLEMNGIDFRIVRLNEDGSIRIVTSEQTAFSSFYSTGETSSYDLEANASAGYLSGALNSWYNSYFANTDYDSLILDNGTFCNDTSNLASSRVSASSYTFKCPVNPIQLKVGIITLDEFWYAGGQNSYLFTGNTFWTMTAYDNATMYIVYYTPVNGSVILTREVTNGVPGAYAALNLSNDTKVTGSGTSSDPYVVQLN